MLYKEVKNDRRHFWTSHSKYKLVQYGLGPNVVKRAIRNPDRVEEGIAPDTVAVMKDRSTKSQEKELWVMYQKDKAKLKIISTWIYPGKTKKGKEVFIPDDTLAELYRE